MTRWVYTRPARRRPPPFVALGKAAAGEVQPRASQPAFEKVGRVDHGRPVSHGSRGRGETSATKAITFEAISRVNPGRPISPGTRPGRSGVGPTPQAVSASPIAQPTRGVSHGGIGGVAQQANPNAGIWRVLVRQRLSRMMRLRPPREFLEEIEPAIPDVESPMTGRVFSAGLTRARVRGVLKFDG